jgi:nicotinate-nucleotide adenylyltransferase
VKKIGLYFGTFNPIHKGHLTLGNYFAQNTDLNEVWFVVTPQNPFKQNDILLKDHHRLEMVRLAIEDQTSLKVSEVEFDRPRPSYTIDTIRYLIKQDSKTSFVLLMGEDNILHFDQWKGYQSILEQIEIYVYPRKHEGPIPLIFQNHEKIRLINAPKLAFASENIRKKIEEGNSVQSLMPKNSWSYLEEMGFYKTR